MADRRLLIPGMATVTSTPPDRSPTICGAPDRDVATLGFVRFQKFVPAHARATCRLVAMSAA